MSRIKDIVGKRHNMLLVISNTHKYAKDGSVIWLCKCDCGNLIERTSYQLSHSVSCGCYRKIKDRKYNTYEQYGNLTVVYDVNNNYALIDTEDKPKILDKYWFKSKHGYFVSVTGTKHSKAVTMHNTIYGEVPRGYEIDHKNRKKYDNRKSNFRLSTRAQNNINHGISKRNSSGYVGVSYIESKNKYRAYITVNNIQKHLGLFDTKESAYEKRLEAERKYFGEFSSKPIKKGVIKK